MASVSFQSLSGPTDAALARSEISGYQPVSRIGEIVINAFVDSGEYNTMNNSLTLNEIKGEPAGATDSQVETRPVFHDWATAMPGMVAVARKKRTTVFRQFVAAETAVPVITAAACKKHAEEVQYYFAGIVRSKSVRQADDGMGPTTDEFFTLTIGGLATILNTSGAPIHAGDLLEWAFYTKDTKNLRSGLVRRIGVTVASVSSSKIIGRAMSFARNGETLDVLVKQ